MVAITPELNSRDVSWITNRTNSSLIDSDLALSPNLCPGTASLLEYSKYISPKYRLKI